MSERTTVTPKRATILVLVFVAPAFCCFIGIGAFVHLTAAYAQMTQAPKIGPLEQLQVETKAVDAFKRKLYEVKKMAYKLRNELANKKVLGSRTQNLWDKTRQLQSTTKCLKEELQLYDQNIYQAWSDTAKLKDQIAELIEVNSRYKDLQAQFDQAREEHASLLSELHEVERKNEEQKNRVSVRGLSDGASRHVRPTTFVECTAEGIIIQPSKKQLGKVPDLTDKNAFLGAVINTHYVMFVIRPDGFESFTNYYELVLSENRFSSEPIDFGYELVKANWDLIYPGQ